MDITLNHLSYTYAKRHIDALVDITATIGPGVHLLLGENGAGKTTLMRIIDGLLFATSGECLLGDADVRRRRPSTLAAVAYLGAEMSFPARDIATMKRIHAPFYPNFDAAKLADSLAAFGIGETTPLRSLSTGNRRKAMTAYMLALGTDVLLLDEPTNGLDIDAKIELQKMLADAATPERTIIVSTHAVSDLQNLYDNLMVLRGGHLVLNAPLTAITAALSFEVGNLRPEQALHAELMGGRWHSVVPRQADTEETDVDFCLIYRALRGEKGAEILSLVNNRIQQQQ